MEPSILEALGQIPYGIYLLTAPQTAAAPHTMVVSWVCQVSFSPPLLTVALRRTRPAIPAVLHGNFFSLNLLREDQAGWVERFKGFPPDETPEDFFETIPLGPGEFRRLKDGLAFFACRVLSKIAPGDHLLLVAEIIAASAAKGRPLITSCCGMSYAGRI
jgi:flavin reductase (DIM6/NTAB) family NADH-FMN oxidoreductase RutF